MKCFSKSSKKISSASAGALMIFAIVNIGINYYAGTKRTLLAESKSGFQRGTVIFNASGIKNKEYPLRHFISHKSIGRVKFLDREILKDNTRTVIIVLGDRPLDGTTPTVNMIYRVLKAVELSKKFPKAVLIMSGGPTAGGISEAEMMGLIAWSRKVNPSRIILEDKSRNTEQNAEFTADIIRSKKIGRKFVITDQSRLKRVTSIFRNYFREFKDVQAVDCNVPIKLMVEQMEQYLKNNDNRIARRRLQQLKNTIKGVAYNAIDKISDYKKIISSASDIRITELPMRKPMIDKEIEKVEFLDPQQLWNGAKPAIFVLPNRPLDEVTPSIDSVYRALKAVELSKKFPNAALIMLGPKTVGDISEAQMMALIAWSRGVDPSKIIVEDKVRSIEDKSEFIVELVRSKNIGQVFIVSKKDHLDRIIPVLQKREESKNAVGVDCGITKSLIIGQMEQYLKMNDDKVIRRRIDNLKKDRIGID